MSWIKVQKNKSYFSRFQVQFRRRRQAKTDYQQRLNMIRQDKDKYEAPKYRFVVRKTNKQIICQIVSSQMNGDRILACAYSSELPHYGVKVGLTNYSAAYCTGLLCGRRFVVKNGLDKYYQANQKVEKMYELEENEERQFFTCYADIGLNRSTTGANVFAAVKGCADSGINIPMTATRLASGYFDKKTGKYNEQVLKDRIYGKHVANYMEELKEEDEDAYKRQFGQYIKQQVKPEDLEEIYKQAHQKIIADPIIKRQYEGSEQQKKDLEFKQRKATSKKHGEKARLAAIRK